jgi:hypothetical protein
MMTRPKRTTRADKGYIKITPRDWSGLRFVAEMRAVRLDHLGQWFAPGLEPAQPEQRIGPAYPPDEKRRQLPWPRDPDKRLKSTYNIVRRWQALRFARLEKPFLDAPMWCWVTRRGLEALGLMYEAEFPVLSDLAHIHQVNHVRLTLARASQMGHQIPTHTWISERLLASQQGERIAGRPVGHRPDGALQLGDGSLEAIEVELTRKSYQRLHAILEALTSPDSGYRCVRYFVSENVAAALIEARLQLDEERQEHVLIYRL